MTCARCAPYAARGSMVRCEWCDGTRRPPSLASEGAVRLADAHRRVAERWRDAAMLRGDLDAAFRSLCSALTRVERLERQADWGGGLAAMQARSGEGESGLVDLDVAENIREGLRAEAARRLYTAGEDDDPPDVDWSEARALQARRRAVPGLPGAVLLWVQRTCPTGCILADRACAAGWHFAPPGLRARWVADGLVDPIRERGERILRRKGRPRRRSVLPLRYQGVTPSAAGRELLRVAIDGWLAVDAERLDVAV